MAITQFFARLQRFAAPLKALATALAMAVLCVTQAQAGPTDSKSAPVAQDLSWINPGDITTARLEDADQDTLAGKLRAYRDAQRDLVAAIQEQYLVYGTYKQLLSMPDEQIEQRYPDGTYIQALSAVATSYGQLRQEALLAHDIALASLTELTQGRRLTDQAMADLDALLGL